jgi:hypothetical protein
MLAAALACGTGTVVSHGSSCELIGLWDVRPTLVDVIPPNWSGRAIEGIRWHRARLPEGGEVEGREGVPCTSPSRTLVDMAGRCGWASLRNVKLQLDDHWLEVDMLWEKQRLAIEADGEETHATPAAFQRDRWRDQLLVASGYRTARVTWIQVRDEPTAVVDRIARMLKTK